MKSVPRYLPIISLLLVLLVAACAPTQSQPPTQAPSSPTSLPLPGTAPATEEAAPTASAPVEMPLASADIMGASLYQLSCAACHGVDRGGNNFEMDGQKISVPTLAWDDLNTMYTTDTSRGTVPDQVALAITKGLDESGEDMNAMMPHWSSLSQAQVTSLTDYLQNAGTSPVPTLEPAATNLMGEQLYLAACAECHGVDGGGKTFIKDDNTISTPALSWSDMNDAYSTNTARGTVSEQVALAITKGQDEKGEDLNTMMPRWSILSQAQVDSLIAYFQSAFK